MPDLYWLFLAKKRPTISGSFAERSVALLKNYRATDYRPSFCGKWSIQIRHFFVRRLPVPGSVCVSTRTRHTHMYVCVCFDTHETQGTWWRRRIGCLKLQVKEPLIIGLSLADYHLYTHTHTCVCACVCLDTHNTQRTGLRHMFH